jgi:hypothetical protein
MSWPVPPHGFLGSQASTAATDNDTYQIGKSLRFNSAGSALLNRTFSTAGNRKIWTWSGWVKRSGFGTLQYLFSSNVGVVNTTLGFYGGAHGAELLALDVASGQSSVGIASTQSFRDPSAWYHIVASVDTTQIVQENRFKLFVNGSQITSLSRADYTSSLNADYNVNSAGGHVIGCGPGYTNFFNGYMAEVNFIDGQALTPSSFGETDAITGRWKAKAFSETYGTNGFYLPFSNTSTGSNSVLTSEDFSAAMYTKDDITVTTNTTTAPNETNTADTLTENSATATHRFYYNNLTYTNGVTFTSSVYVKANTRSAVCLGNWNGSSENPCYADLSTGTIISGSHASSTITSVGNGWYRISVSNVGTGAVGCGSSLYIKNNATAGFLSYTGNGTGSIYVWGAQTEASSTVGPYLVTTGTAIGSYMIVTDASVATGGYNNWFANNLSVTPGVGNDSLTDSPSNYGTISTTLVNDTYQISKSLRFNSADSAYLSRTPASASNRKTWTWSGWVKRGTLGGNNVFMGNTDASGYNGLYFQFDTNNNITIGDYGVGSYVWVLTTSQVFRDTSSWYHIVATFDSTQVTLSDRVSVYINGTKITAFSTATYPSPKDLDGRINSTQLTSIGRLGSYNGFYFDGYLAEVNFIDGQALTPTSFGTRDINTYLWKPKAYTGTYGTNGFYLNFSDSSNTTEATLGKDQAGSNNWTPSGTPGFSVSAGPGNDSLVDSPTYYGTDTGVGGEARGNYATLNPLFGNTGGTITDGNLTLTHTGGANGKNSLGVSSVAMSSGKWYGEVTSITANQASRFGILSTANTSLLTSANPYIGTAVDGYSAFAGGGTFKENNNVTTAITNFGGSSPVVNDVYMVALDLDSNKVWFGRNGSWANSGNPATGTTETYSILSGRSYYFACNTYSGDQLVANFGQRPFIHAAPSGFRALRDYNKLPTPTGGEVRGNYCTLNPLDKGSSATLSDGNLVLSLSAASSVRGTIGVSSGKWYWETILGGTSGAIGIAKGDTLLSSYVGRYTDQWAYGQNATKVTGNVATAYGLTFTTSDIIGVAFDADSGQLTFYKNGSSQGVAFSGLTNGPYFPAFGDNSATTNHVTNFGQRPWAYDAPFGFLPLCTTSLPQPIVQKPSSYMDVVTYTGNNASRGITGLNFSPDLVWIKSRSASTWNFLFDAVRGATKWLASNQTGADATNTTSLTSFDSGGFSLSTDPAPDTSTGWNADTATYVAWAWDESPIAGMDIVSYTGNGTGLGVAHGLGVAPAMYITKSRSATTGWYVYHRSLSGNAIYLNSTAASVANSGQIASFPSSSFFSPGNHADVNTNNATYIAYLFAEVEGFSKIGSYTGNGSADGPFIYCGFRPRYALFKYAGGVANWTILDSARNQENVADDYLIASGSSAEATGFDAVDFVSNGIKIRYSGTSLNASGGTIIFAAFAESPFKYSRAR